MVGTPDIDHPVKAPLILVLMIGNVGGKICRFTVLTHHHPVLVITEHCCPEPEGFTFPVDKLFRLKRGQEFAHPVIFIQFPLAEIDIEHNAEVPQILLDLLQDRSGSIVGKQGNDFFLAFCSPGLAVF